MVPRRLASARVAAATQMMRDSCFSMSHGSTLALRLTSPSLERSRVISLNAQILRAQRESQVQSIVLLGDEDGSHAVCGSNMVEIGKMDTASRAKHYQELANLMRVLGDNTGSAPAVVALDGVLCGSAVGIVLHAPFFVATERTRLWLPGPAFGCPVETLAAYRLSRLPHGIGTYLALTGASLSAPECMSLGLATHMTESHALPRMADALGEGFSSSANLPGAGLLGRISRRLSEACIEPPSLSAWGPEHALFYAPQIEEAFTKETLPEIVGALESGSSEWHVAALECMRTASPLALTVTFAQLKLARTATCWAEAARAEAESCVAAGATRDFAAGASLLQKTKAAARSELKREASRRKNRRSAKEVARVARALEAAQLAEEKELESIEVPVWEHDSIEAVPAELVTRIINPLG